MSVEVEQSRAGLSVADALRDCAAVGVVLIDAERQVVALTGQAAAWLGLHASSLPLPLEALPVAVQKSVHSVFATGHPLADRRVELLAAGREARVFDLNAVPVRPGDLGRGVLLLMRDFGATRRFEQELRQVERLAGVGTLSATAAHEIRNALVAVKTFLEVLLERNQDAELAGIVRHEVGRIDAIVGRMLKFAGPGRSAFASVGLHEVLDQSLRLVQPHLDGKAIALERRLRAAPDSVRGNKDELQQAFLNLLLNALEAMGPRGTLSVATEPALAAADPAAPHHNPKPPAVGVTIRDTGVGISSENLARVFEPFFTTKPNGTGLGLAITRRIIQEHRGEIRVTSHPGQGTAFHIVLPADAM